MPEEQIPDYENMEEVWLPINEFEGYYSVSSYGNIKSVDRLVDGTYGKAHIKERELGKMIGRGGYYRVCLCRNGEKKYFYIHRLVGLAFIHNPNGYPLINHKKGIILDNRCWMLEWCTHSMNHQHAYDVLGRKATKGTTGITGDRNARSIPVAQYNLDGTFVEKYENIRFASIATGISSGNISAALKRARKIAGKFKWVNLKTTTKIICQDQHN